MYSDICQVVSPVSRAITIDSSKPRAVKSDASIFFKNKWINTKELEKEQK